MGLSLGMMGLPVVLLRSFLVLEPYSILLCGQTVRNTNITGFLNCLEAGLGNRHSSSSEKVSCSSLSRLVLIVNFCFSIRLLWQLSPFFLLS